MEGLTREERIALLEDCICPVCEEHHVDYEELLACLREHDDYGVAIANDFIDLAKDMMVDEEADDILEHNYEG